MGVLSALPIISIGNLCCCLWVVSGGVVAAYVLQQNEPVPIMAGDGAIAGLMAGVFGSVVYLALSIPITLLVAPMQRAVLERLIETGSLPPEFRDAMTSYVGGVVGIAVSFFTTLIAGVVFATLGGLLGAAIFRKPPQPSVIDVPPPTNQM
jgi:hypothetical protein